MHSFNAFQSTTTNWYRCRFPWAECCRYKSSPFRPTISRRSRPPLDFYGISGAALRDPTVSRRENFTGACSTRRVLRFCVKSLKLIYSQCMNQFRRSLNIDENFLSVVPPELGSCLQLTLLSLRR